MLKLHASFLPLTLLSPDPSDSPKGATIAMMTSEHEQANFPRLLKNMSRNKVLDTLPKRGAVCRQWITCGKEGCRCKKGERHGPYHYLFWREGGRLRKMYIRKGDLPAVQEDLNNRRILERQSRLLEHISLQNWRSMKGSLQEIEDDR